MTPALNATINATMIALSAYLPASILAKITVTTGACLLWTWLLRRGRASVRHSLLAAAFAILLLLPVASALGPAIPIHVVMRTAAPPQAILHAGAPVRSGAPRVVVPPTTPSSTTWFSLSVFLFAAWVGGAMVFSLPMVAGLWQVGRLRRSSVPWESRQAVLKKLASDAGVGRSIALRLHPALPGPMTCGVLHPAIVLPEEAQNWDEEALTRALLHELDHVRRVDRATQSIARLVCSLYWFHPLVWMARRRLELEAERCCDDAVLAHSEATAYAAQLLEMARRLSGAPSLPLLAMANRADLSQRVTAVLDSLQPRGRAGKLLIGLACAGALAVVLTISPLSLTAAPQTPTPPPAPAPPVVHVPQAPQPPVSPSVPAKPPTAAADAAPVDPPRSHYDVTTQLVNLNVTVKDPAGKAVEGLTAEDFRVSEDNVPQTIAVFESQKEDAGSYYLLGYYSSNTAKDAKFRELRVRTTATNATVRARSGYYSGPPFPAIATAPTVPESAITMDPSVPQPISTPLPEYSEEARRVKFQGWVTLDVEVSASGSVENVTVARPLGLGLDEKAVEAVKQWLFRPALKNGQPTASRTQVTCTFRLL